MTVPKPLTARLVAASVLSRFDPSRNYAGPILDALLPQTTEKQRATDLVMGTIRNRLAIDMLITRLADRPIERIPQKILNVIRIGVYELCYNPQTPDYSVVKEAVENIKTFAGRKQAGFVNAVLRQITAHITNRQSALTDANLRKMLPQTPCLGCEFDTDILPNPAISPADYFSAAFSLPKWLITNWLAEFGTDKTRQICFAANRRPGIYVRPNRLKTTIEQLTEKFHEANIEFETTDDKSILKLKSPRTITELPGFAEGLFSVQDITASQPVRLLKPQPDWTILDLCAAPGEKTTQLAELTDDRAKIIATDISTQRLKKLKENIARLGLNSINIIEHKNLQAAAGSFDAVLLDVPCSNTGALARRPEVRFRLTPQAIQKLAKTQGELLEIAAAMLKPHGRICYSTCSIQRKENTDVIKNFLLKHGDFKLDLELLTLPSAERFDRDGGYTAVLSRPADL